MVTSILAVGFGMKIVAALFILVSITLVLVVLVQKGKGGGLSGAFGGGGAGGLLGTKTGDFLTWFTIGLTAVFLFMAVLMAKYYRPTIEGGAPVQQAPTEVPAGTDVPAQTEQVETTDANNL